MRYSKLAIATALVLFAAGLFVVLANDSGSNAASSVDFQAADVSGYQGETVPVAIYLDSNSGVAGFTITVLYDDSKLSFVSTGSSLSPQWPSAYDGMGIPSVNNPTAGKVVINYIKGDSILSHIDNTNTGTVVTLMFTINTVSDDAALDIAITGVAAYLGGTTILDITSSTTIASPTITAFDNPTATYGQTLSNVTLESGYTWVSPGTSVGSPGTNTFAVNHDSTMFDIDVVVSKADITSAALKSGVQYKYTGSQIIPPFSDLTILPSGAAASDVDITSLTVGDVWDAGTTVTVNVVAKTSSINYQGSASFTFVIQKATGSITITSISSDLTKTYDGNPVSNPTVSVTGDGAVTFTWYPAGDSTAPTNAGSYGVVANLAASTNYTAANSGSLVFGISKASGSISITKVLGKTYDGAAVFLTSSDYTVTGDGVVTITWDTGAGTPSIPAPTNAGSYVARATLAAGTNYEGYSNSQSFTISKANPTINPAYTTPSTLYDTDAIPAISTMAGDTPGTISWDTTTLIIGTNSYGWTFVPTDGTNYNGASGNRSFTVVADTLDHIVIATQPSKTAYADGDAFDTTGMVVNAVLISGKSAQVTNYTVDPATLSISDTSVTVSYTSGVVTKTADVTITVQYGVKYLVGGTLVFTDLYDAGDTVTVRGDFTRVGYIVSPWSIPSTITVTNGEFTMPSSNVDITATQTPDVNYLFTVKYDANGGSFPSAPSNQSVAPDTTVIVQFSKLPQKSGYTFAGWSTSKTASSAQYTQSTSLSGRSVTITSDTTFYAVWKAIDSTQPAQPATPQSNNSNSSGDTIVSSTVLWILLAVFIVIIVIVIIAAVLTRRHGSK